MYGVGGGHGCIFTSQLGCHPLVGGVRRSGRDQHAATTAPRPPHAPPPPPAAPGAGGGRGAGRAAVGVAAGGGGAGRELAGSPVHARGRGVRRAWLLGAPARPSAKGKSSLLNPILIS